MNNLLNVTNAADRAAVIQTNFERLDDAALNIKHINLADVTVANADGEKSLFDAAFEIPADALRAGDRIRIEGYGTITDDDFTPQLQLKLKINGGDYMVPAPLSLTNVGFWRLLVVITVRSIGAAGDFQGMFDWFGSGTDPFGSMGGTLNSFDTTEDIAVDVTASFDGGATTLNVLQLIAKVER